MATSTPSALTTDQQEIHRLLAGNTGNGSRQQSRHQQPMQACIEACTQCHHACRTVLAALSWHSDASQVAPTIQVLLECSDLCALSANLQLAQSPYSQRLCAICAEACRECEHQCMGTSVGEACADACRNCAEHCEAMAA